MSGAPSTAVVLPYWFDRPALEALEIAVTADSLGFPELWVGEMRTFDAFALSAAIARETKRIQLVIGPLPVATRDPAALALGLASAATLGSRPAHLALGASTPVVVSDWHGRSWHHSVRRMRETVTALRPLLAGERSRFSGTSLRCEGFRLAQAPAACEIVVAAFAPKMLRTAIAIADRIVVNLLTPMQVERIRRQIEAVAGELGKPAPPLVVWVPAALDPDEAVWSQLARQLVAYVGAPGYGEMFCDAGFAAVVDLARRRCPPAQLAEAIPRSLVEAVGALGDLATIRSRIQAFQQSGATTVGIVPATANDPGGKHLLTALAER